MSVFSRIKTWTSEVLTASDLNAEFDNIITHMAPDGIEDASSNAAAMQSTADPGGVGTESLPTDLLGEIKRLRYVINRMIGGAQWYSTPPRNLTTLNVVAADLASDSVTTAKILDANVTTVKLADGAVTQAKRADLGQQASSSSSAFSTSSTTAVDVTNLSISITTTGRPVFIGIAHEGTGTVGSIGYTRSSESAGVVIRLLRDATTVSESRYTTLSAGGGSTNGECAPSSFWYIDVPSAGTYTYKIQAYSAYSGSSPNVAVSYCKLIAFEL
jgi:hypothetical protein